MKKLSILVALALFLIVFGGVAAAQAADSQIVTDMAGRIVTVPQTIDALCATGQPGAVLLYTICPEKLIAWNAALAQECLPYFADSVAALPVIGSLQGGKPAANPEEVLALHPDVIIYMTTLTKKNRCQGG